jgi:hypothetical protein
MGQTGHSRKPRGENTNLPSAALAALDCNQKELPQMTRMNTGKRIVFDFLSVPNPSRYCFQNIIFWFGGGTAL